jgi:hypothetical protein
VHLILYFSLQSVIPTITLFSSYYCQSSYYCIIVCILYQLSLWKTTGSVTYFKISAKRKKTTRTTTEKTTRRRDYWDRNRPPWPNFVMEYGDDDLSLSSSRFTVHNYHTICHPTQYTQWSWESVIRILMVELPSWTSRRSLWFGQGFTLSDRIPSLYHIFTRGWLIGVMMEAVCTSKTSVLLLQDCSALYHRRLSASSSLRRFCAQKLVLRMPQLHVYKHTLTITPHASIFYGRRVRCLKRRESMLALPEIRISVLWSIVLKRTRIQPTYQ